MTKYIPINRILLALLVGTSAIILLGTYLYAFDQKTPVEFFNLPFPTDKEQYHTGDTIILTLDYCRYSNAPYTRNLRFVDSLVFSVPEQHRGGANVGCKVVNIVSEIIPESLPPGVYYLSGKNIYPVNFLADRVVEWTSQPFEVIP